MIITKNNYEIYAIDFLENNLDKETRSEMVRFLNNHPVIKSELESMTNPVTITPDQNIRFEPKSLLKKEESKRISWIPTLLKFAAAVALLLSISSVWYLNNRMNDFENSTATAIDSISNKTTKPENNTSINKTTPIINNKSTKTIKAPSIHEIDPTQTPKPTNTLIKKPVKIIAQTDQNGTSTSNYPITKISKSTPTPTPTKQINTSKTKEAPINNRLKLSMKPIELIAQVNLELSDSSIRDAISIPTPPTINTPRATNKSKGSWLINAITKKADGTNIFAFQGVKRALTPTRLRDTNVDQVSSNSPLKQFTND